jgi:hypothetical protein
MYQVILVENGTTEYLVLPEYGIIHEVPTAATFLELTDTPSSYAGQAGQVLVVNATEDGLIFVSGGGGGTGAVDSVFGRTGAVVADANDYASFYADISQGTLANTAVQPNDNISTLTNDSGFITGITALSIDDLMDVDTTSTLPTNGQTLIWNGTAWLPGTISGGGTSAVTTVFGRSGDVIAQAADYASFYASILQGGLADTSVQPGDSIGILVNDQGFITIDDVPATPVSSVFGRTGVITAQVADYASFYATTAQGTLANTAMQPGDPISDLANDSGFITASSIPVQSVFGRTGAVIATSADYSAFYATTAQGGLADSSVQPGDPLSTLTNDSGFITGIGTLSIDELMDVDTVTVPPTNGQALLWNGAGWAPGTVSGGGGAVDSVFGRTGAVVALAADYSAFYASTPQGELADTAVQPGENISLLFNDEGYITLAEIPPSPITSVFGRTGDVVADAADYATFYADTASGVLATTAVQPGDNISS